MPRCMGESERSSSQASSAVGWPQPQPMRSAIALMIQPSSRASPGGSSALRTRCTRRSEFVTVPSDSHQDALEGSTTSASSAVFVEQDVLDDEEVEAGEQLARVLDVGLGLRRVLADHVERAQLAALHALEHLRQVPAVARDDLAAPGGLEAGARLGVALDVLEARQLVRDRAHVAAALHVVLAAQRVEARAPAADVAAEQGEVDQREHVVDADVVLGDAERPADHRPVGTREGVRGVADHVGRHAGDALALGERVRLDVRGVLGEADRRAVDEAVVDEAGVDDLARHRVRQRDVRADVEPEPAVGPLGRGRAARIDGVEPRAVVHALEQVVEEDRMRLTGIRPPQEDDVRLLDLAVGRGPAARTERCRQTDDTGRVSGAVT